MSREDRKADKSQRVKRDIAELLRVWAKNIKQQGFITASSRIVTAAGAYGNLRVPSVRAVAERELR